MKDLIEDMSLTKALSAAPLRSLPRVWDGGDADGYWIRAVCLVLKRDTSRSYTLAVRDAHGRIRHVRDFGHIGMISRVLSVYPYDWLDEAQFCAYSTERTLSNALRSYFGDGRAEEIMGLPEDARFAYVREMGIARQMGAERDGVFVSTEEREAARRAKEEADAAERAVLSAAGSFAVTGDERKVLPLQVISADSAGNPDGEAGKGKKGRKRK